MSTAPALYRTLAFRPLEDFDLIGEVVDVPMTLIAKQNLPPKDLRELVACIKANRDKESGLPGLEVVVWRGVYAPKGAPKPVLDKLVAALQAGIQDPAFVQRMVESGAQIVTQDRATPQGLRNRLGSEIAKWTPIIRKAGVYAD